MTHTKDKSTVLYIYIVVCFSVMHGNNFRDRKFSKYTRNPFKDDEFIFFQRSQRNCEPEKRSLAGA